MTYNDSSDSGLILKNTEKLIDIDKVFALFGYTGINSTYSNIIPFIQKADIPFWGCVSGSESLRMPPIKQVFNIRAGFNDESVAMVDRLIERGLKRIAVVYEETETGSSAFESTRRIMEKKSVPMLTSANISSDLKNIDDAVSSMISANPDAVLMAVSSKVASEFISRIREKKNDTILVAFSFADGETVGKNLLNKSVGVVVNQVVPFPNYLKIPVVAEYTKLSEKYFPKTEPSFAGVEGFIAAKAFCRILEDTEGQALTREAFYKSAESQHDSDVGGFTFSFGPKERSGSRFVYLTQIGPGGFVVPIKTLADIYR
jgi:ABC-type branched-subunit amino acid transport system substrate-binding protein